MATNGYARIGGVAKGVELKDINPTRVKTASTARGTVGSFIIGISSTVTYTEIPVCGYDKVSLRQYYGSSTTYHFCFPDGTTTTDEQFVSSDNFTSWIQIPDGATVLKIKSFSGSSNYTSGNYALLTKESPYNPDNV